MNSFLYYVAQDIIRRYGTDLSRTVVVFPNKRASLFLNEHLAQLAGRPLWSPVYTTISELFRQQSALSVADPIKLVCELHRSFVSQTGSTESLDRFYGWGQLLLSDFDDIDKNLADADRVFSNLRDLHELDDISYLTPEQRDMIRRFFSHFTEEHNSELKQRFLKLWSHFADIYHDFNRRLTAQGLAYEGALYRAVVRSAPAFPYDRYLFVGFNLLHKVEQQLFAHLQREGKAAFYWDFDHYYMQHHEAGQFIGRYLQDFPNSLDTQDADIYRNFRHEKHIEYIAAPTENVQARYVSTWLREHERYRDGRRTAIVLCNEALLPTVIHCLPPEVDKVNVTTGYPLSQTPVAAFIMRYFDLHLGGRSPRLQRAFQRHPYAKYLQDEPGDGSLIHESGDDGSGDGSQIHQDNNLPGTLLLGRLLAMLRQIAQNGSQDTQDPLFQESLFRAYTLVNRLEALREQGDLDVDDTTLQRLTQQLIQQTSIPFHGEPAEGLQVMGVLETRNLDFDHVLLLSCNEGNMPRGVNDSSFIPHSLRQAYELTTVDNKVAIYAYYFHRLLQRAHDVTLLWNNSTEDGQRGEMSRFMLQMLVESGQQVSQYTLQSVKLPASDDEGPLRDLHGPQTIEKTPRVMSVLQSVFQTISPTAINRYQRCPLQFYYRYVGDIREPDVPDDEQELDNRMFGNIFHEAADLIYHQLPQHIERPLLEHLLKEKVTIERTVDEAFHRLLPYAPHSGLHIINREVIIQYLRQLLQLDISLAPFTILGLETDVSRTIGNGNMNIGGRIDRLDLVGEGTPEERIRVVDYKTGSRQLKPLADVEAIFKPENIHEHADYYLQTFVYADIVRRQHPQLPVSPALLFIQHAAAKGYDPTLLLGREPVRDIAQHSEHFCQLLDEVVARIFSADEPFRPTQDLQVCRTCPYATLCRR